MPSYIAAHIRLSICVVAPSRPGTVHAVVVLVVGGVGRGRCWVEGVRSGDVDVRTELLGQTDAQSHSRTRVLVDMHRARARACGLVHRHA